MKKVAVFIGRFQPFHNGHAKIVEHCLNNYDKTIILVGSTNRCESIKQLFRFNHTKKSIISYIDNNCENYFSFNDYSIRPLKDFIYNDTKWISQVEDIVYEEIMSSNIANASITLVGHSKDDSSYYLKIFPNFLIEELPSFCNGVSGTDLREKYLQDKDISAYIPRETNEIINSMPKEWKEKMKKEASFYEQEKNLFASYPFPETLKFNCSDAVVVCDGNILLIQRKVAPGIGTWALPGGFVNRNETYEECAIRELIEETGIKIPKKVILGSKKGEKIFDNPKRNLGIPRITNAFYFQIQPDINKAGAPKLPHIKGNDDAEKAQWFPLAIAKRMELFDDHADIIDYFTSSF